MSCVKSQRGFLYPLQLGDEVNFRLTYDGPLKAAGQSEGRRKEKQAIREVFSRQLLQLHFAKDDFFDPAMKTLNAFTPEEGAPLIRRGDFYFFAVVKERLHLVCDLDILFLRRDNPGQLISGGGDLDNRIKVLFDALRVPQDDNEVRDFGPAAGSPMQGKFMLCLTEDDKLITGFRLTTDRLLEPAMSERDENNVRLIINVEIKATKMTIENMAYFSHF
jgi:hypothetical protein